MMGANDGNGFGVETNASSSGHAMPMAWQWQGQMSNSDNLAWASPAPAGDGAVSGGSFLPPPARGFRLPPAAGYDHFPAGLTASATNNPVKSQNEAAAGGDNCSSSDSKKRMRADEVSNMSADSAGGGEEIGPAVVAATAGKSKKKGAKDADEPPKDGYVHVRARKGQATNSHSLAERLRRERISERMKLLQDIVPGCNKVTGKALMLDEIINYVQSLQKQVEFLSMKLATVNPRLDVDIESLLSKDVLRFPGASTIPIGFSFSPEMMPSRQGMLHGGDHGMANPDMFRTVMQKDEPASQAHQALDGSFHDTTQIQYQHVIRSEGMSIRPDHNGFHM